MTKNITCEKSSGNVYEDMGCKNTKEKLLKANIVAKICEIIELKNIKQKEAAILLKVDQPKISTLFCGKISGFTIDRLFRFLYLLDQNIEVKISENNIKSNQYTL